MLSTRVLDKMPGGKAVWRLRKEYGMTHLETLTYTRSGGSEGMSLLLDWKVTSFPVDVKAIEERNAAYFSARRQRNHSRMEAMNTKSRLDANEPSSR